jgi:hypothetical protein
MTSSPNPHRLDEMLQARFGARVAARLDDAAAELPPQTALRLERTRRATLLRLRLERQPAVAIVGGGAAAATRRGSPSREPLWQRALAWLPVLAMIVGVWAIAEFQSREAARIAAVVDARLLTDVLPPAAYAERGFVEFLREGGAP